MSPASRSKSKDKKAGKEKSSSKPSNTSSGIPTNGYTPMLGTFHTFETAPIPPVSLHVNGRFRNVDETDEHNGNSSVNGIEYDSVSNNGSWSGESEDHKDKTSQPVQRQESNPRADNDKREKICQKNEKKHQRQKERRAQELHEKCIGYLMSRKLEVLAQQLVAMGFSQERATMALIVNEGRMEETISWFFEGSEEHEKMDPHNLDSGGNLKIDISEELARITDIELKYKVSEQKVKRTIVSCEGDLDKAEEMLKAQNEDSPSASTKPKEEEDRPNVVNSKLPSISNPPTTQLIPSSSSTITLKKRNDKEFNYPKAPATVGSSSVDPGVKLTQMLKKIPPKTDWAMPVQTAPPLEKRYPPASFASPTPTNVESRYAAVGYELKNLQLGSVKEPLVLQKTPSFSSTPGWYPNSVETKKLSNPQFLSRNGFSDPQGFSNGYGGSGASLSPSIAAPSSLGLFSSGTGSSPSVDWKTGGSVSQFDYSSIDWSLDRGSLSSRPARRLWMDANYSVQDNGRSYSMMQQDSVGAVEWNSPFEGIPRQFVSSPTL